MIDSDRASFKYMFGCEFLVHKVHVLCSQYSGIWNVKSRYSPSRNVIVFTLSMRIQLHFLSTDLLLSNPVIYLNFKQLQYVVRFIWALLIYNVVIFFDWFFSLHFLSYLLSLPIKNTKSRFILGIYIIQIK